MKAASRLPDVKCKLLEKNLTGIMVENCVLPNEYIYPDTEQIPEQAGYYTTVLVKKRNMIEEITKLFSVRKRNMNDLVTGKNK